jgi:hypothetical protein
MTGLGFLVCLGIGSSMHTARREFRFAIMSNDMVDVAHAVSIMRRLPVWSLSFCGVQHAATAATPKAPCSSVRLGPVVMAVFIRPDEDR